MAQIIPQGRFLTLSLGASSAVLYCKEINFSVNSILFTRQEYNKSILKGAPESTGAVPTYSQALSGLPVQFVYASATTARDQTPNNLTSLQNMEKKFFFNEYTITGDTSLSADTGLVYTWGALHKTLNDRYEAQQKYGGDGLSYQDLLTLQAVTFSYLTTTGLSLSGSTLGALSNLLIQSFSVNPTHDISGGGQTKILYEYQLTLRQIQIYAAAAT